MPELFSAHDYSVEYCKSEGNKMSTTMIVLAFYYFKILTPERRRRVYLNPGVIYSPPTKYDRPDFGDRSLFHAELNRFISDTPPHIELKVSCFGRPEHAMLLVFDVPNQRLEFYDPMADLGGMYFHDGADFYAYLKKHARTLKRENPGLRHIWANVERMQQDAKSCTLWASTTAICRMAGIGRERLPTLNSDILSISNVVRHVLWETCQFKEFGGLWTFTRESVDKAIRECRVPEEFRFDSRQDCGMSSIERAKSNSTRHSNVRPIYGTDRIQTKPRCGQTIRANVRTKSQGIRLERID